MAPIPNTDIIADLFETWCYCTGHEQANFQILEICDYLIVYTVSDGNSPLIVAYIINRSESDQNLPTTYFAETLQHKLPGAQLLILYSYLEQWNPRYANYN